MFPKQILAIQVANTISRLSYGNADDLASTVVLASNKKIILVPAMNVRMWSHKATQENVNKLKDYGIYNNLIPTLLREVENNTLIICLKDNYIYGNDFIENIIQDSDNSNEIIQNNYCTVLKPKFVNKNIVNYDKNNFDMDWVKTHSKVPIKYKKYSNIFKKF